MNNTILDQDSLVIEDSKRIVRLSFSEILYIESIKRKGRLSIVSLYQNFEFRMLLKSLYKKLDAKSFIYASQSTIVNLRHIVEIDKHNRLLRFRNGSTCYYTDLFSIQRFLLHDNV